MPKYQSVGTIFTKIIQSKIYEKPINPVALTNAA